MSQDNPSPDEQFATRSREYGVAIREVSPGSVAETIDDAIDPPAVGVELPWEDVELPASVRTVPTAGDLKNAATGVTAASLAVAEYGSIVLRADREGSEPLSLFNDHHIAVLRREDIVPDMTAAFEWFGSEIRETGDSAILATGPSATADMGALVQGAHGPKAVTVVVVS